MAALYSYPPTPYAIGLAILIVLVQNKVILHQSNDALEELLERCLLDRIPPDVTLAHLLHHECFVAAAAAAQADPDDRAQSSSSPSKLLGEWLHVATESIDAFVDLLSSVSTTMTNNTNVTSRADIFRRRVGVNCERLSMTEVVVLFHRFAREIKEATYHYKSAPNDVRTNGYSARKKNRPIQLADGANLVDGEFDDVLTCLQQRDRVGAIHALHATMDHSIHALTAAGAFSALVARTFGESTVAARHEAIRAVQKQGEHHNNNNSTNANSTNNNGGTPTGEGGGEAQHQQQQNHHRREDASASLPQLGSAYGGGHPDDPGHRRGGRDGRLVADDDDDDVDPEMAMLQSQLYIAQQQQQQQQGSSKGGSIYLSLDDWHVVARKQFMGRYEFGDEPVYDNAYYEAIQVMLDHCSSYGGGGGAGDQDLSATTAAGGSKTQTPPLEYIGFFLHEWAVRREDWHTASAWLAALECYLHPRLDAAVLADYISQKAFGQSRRGQWRAAVTTIEEYLEQQKREHWNWNHAETEDSGSFGLDFPVVWDRLCLQLGQILLDAQQYTSAQAALLQCRPCAASLSLLAILHLEFYHDRSKALGFCRAALPKLMLQEHLFLQGQAWLTMARCTGDLNTYEKSLACFRVIQDVTALRIANKYYAHECHVQQLYEQRDRAAAAATTLNMTVVENATASPPLPDSDELASFIEQFAASGRAVLWPR